MKLPLPWILTLMTAPSLAAAPFDVRAFGAVPDGRTLNTPALQRAIDTCHDSGGGTVVFPAGTYLSGTLVWRSNVVLHLDAGAILLGSPQIEDYRRPGPPAGAAPAHPELNGRHLLYAENAENLGLEGAGVIDGNGASFFDAKMKPRLRPSPLIELRNSRRIRIENVTIRNAPAWTLRPKNCDDVRIRGVSLLNDLAAVNTDGIDVDSTRNVMISDCHIEAGDDCIVLKTTEEGGVARATENVVVSNCVLVSSATALKLGTESHGDFRHCLFTNCVIRDSRTGVGVFANDGATIEDVRFSQLAITTRPKWGQGLEWPIVVDIGLRRPDSRLSRIRDLSFEGLTLYTRGRIAIGGRPGRPIENVRMRDITVRVTGYEDLRGATKMNGGATQYAAGAPNYAETPAVFILTHLSRLALDGIEVLWPGDVAPEARHALYGDHVDRYSLRDGPLAASTPDLDAIVWEHSTPADVRSAQP